MTDIDDAIGAVEEQAPKAKPDVVPSASCIAAFGKLLDNARDSVRPYLQQHGDRLMQIAMRLVPEFRGEQEPTFRTWCLRCGRTGFVTEIHIRRDYGSYDAVWFCTCRMGQQGEAGYWFDKVYPSHEGKSRRAHGKGQEEYREYVLANPERTADLEANMAALKKSYNDQRRRKLAESTEG